MGYNLFGGKFWHCVDGNYTKLSPNVVNSEKDCKNATNKAKNYTWVNKNINFDNSINGFLALFQTVRIIRFLF